MEAIETIEYKGYKIKIYQDESPIDPREDDNFGTMLCKHNSYDLGDVKESKAMNHEEIKEFIKRKDVISLSLYLYDHSGLYLKSSRNGNPWYGRLPQGHAEFDSGLVGFIVVTKEKILKEWSKKRMSKALTEKAFKLLESEVQTYADYIEGNVVGYVIEKDGDHIDSCWGFYPEHNNGSNGFEYMIKECKSQIDYHITKEATYVSEIAVIERGEGEQIKINAQDGVQQDFRDGAMVIPLPEINNLHSIKR